MNQAKIDALMDTLKAACSRQFRFNPKRVAAGMRYMGTEVHGANQVHVFRDTHTHSQIELKLTMATLREHHGEKPHWTEAEMARYRHTDAEIEAEAEAKRAFLDFTRQSALYRDHREALLARNKRWPGYRPDGPTAKEAARALIVALTEARDARLLAFIDRAGTSDTEELAHLLLAPCHIEVEEQAALAKPGNA